MERVKQYVARRRKWNNRRRYAQTQGTVLLKLRFGKSRQSRRGDDRIIPAHGQRTLIQESN